MTILPPSVIGGLLAMAMALAGQAAARVTIDGSSTVYPIAQAAAVAYHRSIGAATVVTIGISGTGGGFRKFCRGEIDIANASRPITKEELRECRAAGVEFVEIPLAFDAITIVVNPRNTFLHEASLDQLRRLWEPGAEGRVRRWRDLDARWPDAPIRLYAPGGDSGTFDYFTEAVVGKARASRRDYMPSEDDNVLVKGVMREPHALGYFGFAYYWENRARLRALAISADGGRAVAPSPESIAAGTYRPLSRPLFVYLSARALERADVREFAEMLVSDGARFAREARYIPLPADAYPALGRILREGRTGTVFGGAAPIGISITELLRRETRR